jgi:translation initiation factor 2 beta subunit (eIF-2beta)/eIF-5
MEEKNMEFLFDAASRVLEASTRNELSINKQINKAEEINTDLKKTIEKLNQTKSEINVEIKKTLNDNSKTIAKEITKEVLNNFQEANNLAIEASEIYKKAIKWSIGKLFIFALILFLLTMLPIVVYYKFFLPKEINTLNQEKEILTQNIQVMQNNVDELKKLGGNINLINCNDGKQSKKCVEVVPIKVLERNGKEYRLLKLE